MSPNFSRSRRLCPQYRLQLGVQAAPTASKFAKSKEFCKKGVRAVMRYRLLQFDGSVKRRQRHRAISATCFDVKLRAHRTCTKAGHRSFSVVTSSTTSNTIIAVREVCDRKIPRRISFAASSPCSFTGRDEDYSGTRLLRTIPLSHSQRLQQSSLARLTDARLGPDLFHQHVRGLRDMV